MLKQILPIAAVMELPPISAPFTHDYLAYQPLQQSNSYDVNLPLSSDQCPTSVFHPLHRTPSFGTPLPHSLLSSSPVTAIPPDQAIGPTESDRVTRKHKRCALVSAFSVYLFWLLSEVFRHVKTVEAGKPDAMEPPHARIVRILIYDVNMNDPSLESKLTILN